MGLGLSELFVCERLGYDHERVTRYTANSLAQVEDTFDPLNVVIVNTSAQPGRLPSTPGFKDGLFITDKGDGQGMITKREVRLVVLSYLGVEAKEVVWDIGAGCGGVSVELAYWNPESEVYAIEHHETRLSCLEANREHFGVVKNLHVVHGRAPEAFANLPAPKRVFIGGSDGEMAELLDEVWQRLPLGGVLLVNAVTDATMMETMAFLAKRDAAQDAYDESSTIQVYRSERLAGKRIRRPHLPVSLWRFEKCLPGEHL
jgi:precorrin-6Y C5,15-methyltransferase (decarboxylating)